MENSLITYILTREKTQQQTGFFGAVPDKVMTLDEAMASLALRPQDDFLHQHVLMQIVRLSSEAFREFLDRCEADANRVGLSLAAEYLFLAKDRKQLEKRFSVERIRNLSRYTPLIYLRSFLEPDQMRHSRWTTFFGENLKQLEPLPAPHKTDLPPLRLEPAPSQAVVTLAELFKTFSRTQTISFVAIPPGRTADVATDRLERAGVVLGQLMRHEASLSPIGLLRSWQFTSHVYNRRNRFVLSGEQISYGRGLTADAARASLMMEIVERYSAFASVSEEGLENYQHDYPLRRASFSELEKSDTDDVTAINPAHLALEVSYQDQPLHWVRGETIDLAPKQDGGGRRPAWLPVQCLFLFCNLDEPALFSSLGSTGLASGNTLAQAKAAALLEIVERHQAATVPYDLSSCFQLVARDSQIAPLLEAYRHVGIHLWFQDITPPSGIPCCRCFVVEKTGEIHVGTAAHLDARRAILSAITETTCPFPKPPPTRPAPQDLTRVGYENLPDYSTHDDVMDLSLLESLLLQNSFQPFYIDLTRADVGLPVVKAIVPGREIIGDFDDYSRVHPELYHNYLSLFKSNERV